MTIMVRRFCPQRWSDERRAIHAMPVGGMQTFAPEKFHLVFVTVQRLNHAYAGEREWVCQERGGVVVKRLR